MKKILLSAFALLSAMTMSAALITSSEVWVGTDAWGLDAAGSGEIKGYNQVDVARTNQGAGEWRFQIKLIPTDDLVLAADKSYTLSFDMELEANEGELTTGAFTVKVTDINDGADTYVDKKDVTYTSGKQTISIDFDGNEALTGNVAIIVDLGSFGYFQGSLTDFSIVEQGQTENLLEGNSPKIVAPEPGLEPEPTGDILVKKADLTDADFEFDELDEYWPAEGKDGNTLYQVTDYFFVTHGEWDGRNISAGEVGGGRILITQDNTSNYAERAGIQVSYKLKADDFDWMEEGDYYIVEMYCASNREGAVFKEFNENPVEMEPNVLYTYAQQLQCTGEGVNINGELSLGITIGCFAGLMIEENDVMLFDGVNVYASDESGAKGKLLFSTNDIPDPVAEESASVLVYGNEGKIIVEAEGAQVSVYTVAGAKVYEGSKSEIDAAAGVYVVVVDGVATKVIVK